MSCRKCRTSSRALAIPWHSDVLYPTVSKQRLTDILFIPMWMKNITWFKVRIRRCVRLKDALFNYGNLIHYFYYVNVVYDSILHRDNSKEHYVIIYVMRHRLHGHCRSCVSCIPINWYTHILIYANTTQICNFYIN